MKFAITEHARSGAPADALDLLWERLGPLREGVRFEPAKGEIRATVDEELLDSMEVDIRTQMGRRLLLRIVEEVCEGNPGLKFAWFAVAPTRY